MGRRVRAKVKKWLNGQLGVTVEITSLCLSRGQCCSKILSDDVVCLFLVSVLTTEGMISKDVVYMVATDAWCVGRIDGEPELAMNAEEESEWGEAVCGGALRHCNEWVGCGGG